METIETAEWGLADLVGADPRRRIPGLRNVITWGRATTNVLQNLRSVVKDFDVWYEPLVEEMKQDELMKYFYDMRTPALKGGTLKEVSSATVIKYATGADLMKTLGPPPPGAHRAFFGDYQGGSGWEVELPDGTIQKYYVALPVDAPVKTLHFPDPPTTHLGQTISDTSVDGLAQRYIAYLRRMVDKATQRFG